MNQFIEPKNIMYVLFNKSQHERHKHLINILYNDYDASQDVSVNWSILYSVDQFGLPKHSSMVLQASLFRKLL